MNYDMAMEILEIKSTKSKKVCLDKNTINVFSNVKENTLLK